MGTQGWNGAAQEEQLQRVSSKIAELVLGFCRERLSAGSRFFFIHELTDFVWTKDATVAPDSPGRILRMLKRCGRMDYRVVNRRQSLYCLAPDREMRP